MTTETKTKTKPKPSVIPYKREERDIYALIDFNPGEPEAQPDAMLQEPILRESVVTPLADWITDGGLDQTVFVSSDTILCYDRSDLNRRIQPDCYAAFGVDVQAILDRELYLPWEVGKVPDFALEVASRRTARRDLTTKREIYRQMEVPELWLVDGTGGDLYGAPLIGWRLSDGEYLPIPITVSEFGDEVSGYSPTTGLRLCFTEGEFRFQDPLTGKYLAGSLEGRRAYREKETELIVERDAHRETRAELVVERAERVVERAEMDAERAEHRETLNAARAEHRETLNAERTAHRETQAELDAERAARERSEREQERGRERIRRLQEQIRRMGGGGDPPQD